MKKEIISRRQFFKTTAKSALPFLMGVALIPDFIACKKDESIEDALSCGFSCQAECASSCSNTCSSSAVGVDCKNGCSSSCGNECSTSCQTVCSETSTGSGCSSCGNSCQNSCGETCSNGANNNSGTTISEASGTVDNHEYVDLGLSVKWARCNVNASQPQYNGYSTYNAFRVNLSQQERVQLLISLGYYGQSGKRELGGVSDVDMTTDMWGDKWRTPSRSDWDELKDNCDSEAIQYEGVDGIRFTSRKNGKSIFIPLSGRRFYSNGYKREYVGENVALQTSTFLVGSGTDPDQYLLLLSKNGMGFCQNSMNSSWEEKAYLRGVTAGGGNPSGCNNSCVNSASGNSCSSCNSSCMNTAKGTCDACTAQCMRYCSTACVNSCNDLCDTTCEITCNGYCDSSCSGGSKSGCISCYGTCSGTCGNICAISCSGACNKTCKGTTS